MSTDPNTRITAALLDAIKAEGLHLYTDEWARRLNWTVHEVESAARQLKDDGLLSIHSAPHGALLAPTLSALLPAAP